jgi:hypothetical protein
MDKKIIKGLIGEKLEVIQEQFSIIREYEGKIPVIELDLIMTSIRDLYELVLSLQIENMGSIIPKPAPQPETIKTSPQPEISKPAPQPAPVRLSPGIINMEPVSGEEPVKEVDPVKPEPPVSSYVPPGQEPEVPPAPVHEAEPDRTQPNQKYQRITFDLFSENGSSLADRMHDGQERRVADNPGDARTSDLRTSIGINDKFLFINELFEGNMRIYDEAIQKLNAGTTVAQADLLLLDLKIVYNWDSESPTVKKFVELVRRKF